MLVILIDSQQQQ